MNFFTIVIRGLLRRPVRTFLTLFGISIGIAAVVALVGMANGYQKSVVTQLEVIGVDVIVSNMEGGITPKPFEEGLKGQIDALPNTEEVTTVLMQMLSVETAQFIMVSGREWGGFTWDKLEVVEGRMPRDEEERAVVLGTLAADVLGKEVGDMLQIEIDDFEVVGIVDGKSVVENGAILMALPRFQEVLGYEGLVNFIDIKVPSDASDADVDALCEEIGRIFPKGRANRIGEVVETSQAFRVARAMSWSTSALAIIVGVLGVMNTMLMTVFERTHEIGILLALGWKRRMIVLLVIYESAILGFLGGAVGVALGAFTLAVLKTTPAIHGLLEPDFGWELVVQATLIAVIVGIVSGLYPAWRSSRLTPSVALQS